MARISFSVLQKPRNKQGILKPDGQGYYEQVIGGLNIDNSSVFKRKMDRGVLRGENGHPKFSPGMSKADFINRIYQIYEDRTCVHFKDIWLDNTLFKNPDGSAVWTIMAKFTPVGELCYLLDKELRNGCENVCFSIRSITEDYTVGGKIYRDIVEIITFDHVNEPGIAIAEKYKSPALESIARGVEVLVTQDDFMRACDEAVSMGVATESHILASRDQIFKQFGWKQPIRKPGYMDLY